MYHILGLWLILCFYFFIFTLAFLHSTEISSIKDLIMSAKKKGALVMVKSLPIYCDCFCNSDITHKASAIFFRDRFGSKLHI